MRWLDGLPQTQVLVRATIVAVGIGLAAPPAAATPPEGSFVTEGSRVFVLGEARGRGKKAEQQAHLAAIARTLAALREALAGAPDVPPPPADPLEEARAVLAAVPGWGGLVARTSERTGRTLSVRYEIPDWPRLVEACTRRVSRFGLELVQPFPSVPVQIAAIEPDWPQRLRKYEQDQSFSIALPRPGDVLARASNVEIHTLADLESFPSEVDPLLADLEVIRNGVRVTLVERLPDRIDKAPTCGPCCHGSRARDCR